MTLIDAVGYLASALVLLTFCMSTMLRLRAVAICSNLAFVGYGLGEEVYPVLILHLILLPLNVWLLVQMTLLLRKAKLAAATDPFASLVAALHAGKAIQGRRDHF